MLIPGSNASVYQGAIAVVDNPIQFSYTALGTLPLVIITMTKKPLLITRRQFLITGLAVGGGLAIGYGLKRLDDGDAAEKFVASTPDSFAMNAWIKLHQAEKSPLPCTAQKWVRGFDFPPMMLAEEMDADWSMVRYEFAPVDKDTSTLALWWRTPLWRY